MPRYVKAHEAAEYYHISESNLRKWAREKKITTTRTPGGHFRYILPDPTDVPQQPDSDGWTPNVIYVRVSSAKQHEDLQRQSLRLQQLYPNHTLVQDIGSGLNYQRKGFQALLERLFQGHIKHVVVAHQDRFCRFGYDFFCWMFQQFGAILESVEQPPTDGEDMVNDIMEIFTVFTARYYGRRSHSKNHQPKVSVLPEQRAKRVVS
jgi:predicted site-specific integrase-resolvase